MALSLCTYDSLTQLEALRPAWEELMSNYLPATTFSTWEWLSSWWSCFGRNRRLLVLALFDSGRIVGLAPLSISAERLGWFWFRVLRLMGDGSNDSDNLDVPVLPGYESAFAESVLTYLRQHKREWDICQLNTLPLASPGVSCLIELLRSSSWTFWERLSDAWAVELPDSWDLYSQILLRRRIARTSFRYTRRLQTRTFRTDSIAAAMRAICRVSFGCAIPVAPGTMAERGAVGNVLVVGAAGILCPIEPEFTGTRLVGTLGTGTGGRDRCSAVRFSLPSQSRSSCRKDTITDVASIGSALSCVDTFSSNSSRKRSEPMTSWVEKIRTRSAGAPAKATICNSSFLPASGSGAHGFHFVHQADRSKEWLRQTLPASAWSVLHKTNVFFRGSKQTEKSDSASATDKFDEKAAGLQV